MVMSECPAVSELETTDLSPALRTHVAGCAACRAVVELVVDRALAAPGDCGEFEDLLALRTDTKLDGAEAKRLDRHLAECEHCRAIASGAMTISDVRAVRTTRPRSDVSALREVDPDAYGTVNLELPAR
jgi:Putative zinc-finger